MLEHHNDKPELALLPFSDNGQVKEQDEDWTVLHRPLSDRCHDVTHVFSQLFPELLSRQPSVESRHHRGGEHVVAGHGNFDLASRYLGEIQKLNDELEKSAQELGPQLRDFFPRQGREKLQIPARDIEPPSYSLPTMSFTNRKTCRDPLAMNPPALTQDGPVLQDTAVVKTTKNNKQVAERLFKQMQAKQKYLRNSRTASTNQVTQSRHYSEKSCFVAEPTEVLFTFDKIHATYKSQVFVKNVSGVSQSFRLKQPASSQFSIKVADVSQPTTSCVAPGMSVHCEVCFTADKVTDFEDHCVVVFGNGEKQLTVYLKASPQPVELRWNGDGDELDCGYCLPGGSCRRMFTCYNEGVAGTIELVTAEQWSSGTWASQGHLENPPVSLDSSLAALPFQITPAQFYLKHKECQEVQVLFSPQSVGIHHCEVFTVFNKLQALPLLLSGAAEDAVVELIGQLKGNAWSVQSFAVDCNAPVTLTMPDVNPHRQSEQEITLQNCSNVDLQFSWCMVEPEDNGTLKLASCHEVSQETSMWSSSSIDSHTPPCFEVHPTNGQLPAHGEQTITFQCKPKLVGHHTAIVHLFVGGRHAKHSLTKQLTITLQLALKAVPYQVVVEPEVLVLPGPILIGKEVRIPFKVSNRSLSSVKCSWKSVSAKHSLSVEPAQATLDVDGVLLSEVVLCANACKSIEAVISCCITHSSLAISIPVLVKSVVGAEVTIDLPAVDFGLVQVGKKKHVMLPLRNLSPVDTQFCITDCGEPGLGSSLMIVPSHDTIPALGVCTALATFHAQEHANKDVSTFLECRAPYGVSSYVRVEGMVGVVQACLRPSSLKASLVMQVTETTDVFLVNLSCLSSVFVWSQVGENKGVCEVRASPMAGVLAAGENLNIKLSLTAQKQTDDIEIIMACEVKGMDKPLVLAIQVSASGPNISCDKSGIDFGQCVVGKPVSTTLQLFNHTALSSRVHCYVVNFPSGVRNYSSSLASRRPVTIGFSEPAKAHLCRDFMQDILSLHRGAAIVVDPHAGMLPPNGVLDVCLTAYSDIWGEYDDIFVCEIDGQVVAEVPLRYAVVGCPLGFRIAANSDNQYCATLSFGKHLADTPDIERVVQITNHSSCDIRVDWKLLMETPDDNEDKLVNVHLRLGDPFPKLSADNEWIERESKHEKTLVGVVIAPHEGTRSDGPFSIREKQVVVPAFGSIRGSVTFHPRYCPAGDCVSLLKGYLSLDMPHQEHVRRSDGYDATTVTLRLLAGREESGVLVEDMDDEPWSVAADTVLSHLDGKMLQRALILSNTTPAGIHVHSTSTFQLITRACAEGDGALVIPPHGRMSVCVGLKLTSAWLADALQDAKHGSSSKSCSFLQKQNSLLVCKGNLTVAHGTSNYVHPVDLSVHLPCLHASTTDIQFGCLYLGMATRREAILRNVSSSRASFVVSNGTDAPGVWKFEPASGVISTLSEGSEATCMLTIVFSPQREVSYDTEVEITVHPGGESLFLRLQGQGKIDGI